MLQRGRARAGAECVEFAYGPKSPGGGFNGAAPARARNVIDVVAGIVVVSELQRGRARAGAEWGTLTTADSAPATLQRGRARAGAECLIAECNR